MMPFGALRRRVARRSDSYRDDTHGVVTFRDGGFAADCRTRPEFAARNYYELRLLRRALDEHLGDSVSLGVEIGSGYGRLSPWIADYCDTFLGVEPNADARSAAEAQYPHLAFEDGTAALLGVDSGSADLLVSWTVLQHVPPDDLGAALAEIRRALNAEGLLVLCEDTDSAQQTETCWPHPVEEWNRLLDGFELIESTPRELEPTYPVAEPGEVMCFRNRG